MGLNRRQEDDCIDNRINNIILQLKQILKVKKESNNE